MLRGRGQTNAWGGLALVAALVLMLALGAGGAGAATPGCTIKGTAHADHLVGTPHRDVICGMGGNDRIDGRGGNDVLIGGPGNDRLNGGPGKDDLRGGQGNDVLSGGPGRDTCADALATAGKSCERWVPAHHAGHFPHKPPPDDCCTVHRPPDTQAPAPVKVAFERRYVDTSTGDNTMGVHVEAWDESGLGPATIQIDGPSGSWRTLTLRPSNGMRLEATFPVPASTPSGDYRVTALTIADTKGNSHSMSSSELEASPLHEFEVFHGPDTEGPRLTGFALSAEGIDTSSAPGAITMAIGAEDPLAGVKSVYVAIQLPGWEPSLIRAGLCTDEEPPNVGTRHAGTWIHQYGLIQHAMPGTYVVSSVYLCDLAGNVTSWTKEELEDLGYQTEFVETGPGDSTGPEVLGFWFDPTTLHAAAGQASVDYYVHVRDGDTGFGGPRLTDHADIQTSLSVPGGAGVSFSERPPELISGSGQDGIWKGVKTLEAEAPIGAYNLNWLTTEDRAGNLTEIKAPELSGLGGPLTFENLP